MSEKTFWILWGIYVLLGLGITGFIIWVIWRVVIKYLM